MGRSGISPWTKKQVYTHTKCVLDRERFSFILHDSKLIPIFLSLLVILFITFTYILSSMHDWIGCGFQTKQKYRFGWFSMNLKLVGGDSAGVVTAYYVSLWHSVECIFILNIKLTPTFLSIRVIKIRVAIVADVHRKWGRARERWAGFWVLGE